MVVNSSMELRLKSTRLIDGEVKGIMDNADIFPFGFLSKPELLDLHGIDMPSQLAMFPSFAVCSKLSKMPSLNDFDKSEYKEIISSS